MKIEYTRNNEEHITSVTTSTIEDKDAFGNKVEREMTGIIAVITLKQSSFVKL